MCLALFTLKLKYKDRFIVEHRNKKVKRKRRSFYSQHCKDTLITLVAHGLHMIVIEDTTDILLMTWLWAKVGDLNECDLNGASFNCCWPWFTLIYKEDFCWTFSEKHFQVFHPIFNSTLAHLIMGFSPNSTIFWRHLLLVPTVCLYGLTALFTDSSEPILINQDMDKWTR